MIIIGSGKCDSWQSGGYICQNISVHYMHTNGRASIRWSCRHLYSEQICTPSHRLLQVLWCPGFHLQTYTEHLCLNFIMYAYRMSDPHDGGTNELAEATACSTAN